MNEATVIDPVPVDVPVDDLNTFVRLPGVFRHSEIEEVLVSGAGFHVEHAGAAIPGTDLFYVYRQVTDANLVPSSTGEAPAGWELPAGAQGARERRGGPLPQLGTVGHDRRGAVDEPSLGELKARHREDHLCLRCNHHLVCGMAKSLDPNLLVTIAMCLGFEVDEGDDAHLVCELTPIEPLAIP